MAEDSETIEVRGESINVGAKLLAVNEEGKYLLIRRNPEKYPEMANRLDIPGGRWIKDQEVIPKTLERELGKETGLTVISEPDNKPEFIAKQKFPHTRIKKLSIVRLTYRAQVTGPVQLSDEHSEYMWVTPQEMKEMSDLDPLVKDLLDQGLIK